MIGPESTLGRASVTIGFFIANSLLVLTVLLPQIPTTCMNMQCVMGSQVYVASVLVSWLKRFEFWDSHEEPDVEDCPDLWEDEL